MSAGSRFWNKKSLNPNTKLGKTKTPTNSARLNQVALRLVITIVVLLHIVCISVITGATMYEAYTTQARTGKTNNNNDSCL